MAWVGSIWSSLFSEEEAEGATSHNHSKPSSNNFDFCLLNLEVLKKTPLKFEPAMKKSKNSKKTVKGVIKNREEVQLFEKLDPEGKVQLEKLNQIINKFSSLNLESSQLDSVIVAVDSKKGPIVPMFTQNQCEAISLELMVIECDEFLHLSDLQKECQQIIKLSNKKVKTCILFHHVQDLMKLIRHKLQQEQSSKQILGLLKSEICAYFSTNFLLVFSGNLGLSKGERAEYIKAFPFFFSLRTFDINHFFENVNELEKYVNLKLSNSGRKCDLLETSSELVKHKLTFLECDVVHVSQLILEHVLNFSDSKSEEIWEAVKQKALGRRLEGTQLQIPQVDWEDIGGMDLVKHQILSLFDQGSVKDEAAPETRFKKTRSKSKDTRHGGVLFFGPPGTGKTLLAKCIAKNMKANFLSVKGPELLNMYIGESEANLRKIFSTANSLSPCFIFFDELDSLFPKRDSAGDSGNVSGRLVSQFLTELDNTDPGVHVIAATNRPDLLDSGLLVSGRFDKKIFLGAMKDSKKRLQVLQSVTRHMGIDQDQLVLIEEKMPPFMTGADVYALCVKAFARALKRKQRELDERQDESVDDEECKVGVEFEDVEAELGQFKSSLDAEERGRYDRLAERYADVVIQ